MAVALAGNAMVLFNVSVFLLVISCIILPIRTVVRMRIKAFGLDDWLMVIGLAFFIPACVSTILGAFNGIGTPDDRLNTHYQQQGKKWLMFFQLFYVLSTVPIKASICVALLRITTRRVYQYILYAVMILATIACLTTDIAVLAWCKPIPATWKPELGTCGDSSIIVNVSYFISAVSICTDWTCAILPAFILWDVKLRFRIKASVAVVLGLGVIASSATLVRLKYLSAYNAKTDYLNKIASIAIWSITESGVGIFAGSLATLRPLLRYVPFLGDSYFSGSKSKSGATGHHQNGITSTTTHGRGTGRTTTITAKSGNRTRDEEEGISDDSDNDSSNGVGGIGAFHYGLGVSGGAGGTAGGESHKMSTIVAEQHHDWERLSDDTSSESQRNMILREQPAEVDALPPPVRGIMVTSDIKQHSVRVPR